MKNLIIALMLLLFMIHEGWSQSLVACWPLDNGSVNDTTAWANFSTQVGTLTPVPDRFGIPQKAMQFGQSNSINVFNFPLPGTGGNATDYSFVLWANLLGANPLGDDALITIGGEMSNPNNLSFALTFAVNNNNRPLIKSRDINTYSVKADSLVVPPNQWVMLAVTRNVTTNVFKFVVNNIIDSVNITTVHSVGTLPPTFPYPLTTNSIANNNIPVARIGSVPPTYSFPSNPNEFCNGALDDVQIYNGVLSDSTLLAKFAAGPVGVSEVKDKPFTIFPNPVNDIVQVRSTKHIDTIVITDVAGHVVANVFANDLQSTFDVSGFNPGIYIIQVKDKKGRTSQNKFIIN